MCGNSTSTSACTAQSSGHATEPFLLLHLLPFPTTNSPHLPCPPSSPPIDQPLPTSSSAAPMPTPSASIIAANSTGSSVPSWSRSKRSSMARKNLRGGGRDGTAL